MRIAVFFQCQGRAEIAKYQLELLIDFFSLTRLFDFDRLHSREELQQLLWLMFQEQSF